MKLSSLVIIGVFLMIAGSSVVLSLKPASGPSSPVVARELIQSIVPATWKIVADEQGLIGMTKEYFPDPQVQSLALVGPQVDHTRWTDHQGIVHVEDWSRESLYLWIIPGGFKPKFPNFFDHMAGGAILPTQIFSSAHVCVYGYITNSGADVDRLRTIGKDCTVISTDPVNPSWSNWSTDIKSRLATVDNHGTL